MIGITSNSFGPLLLGAMVDDALPERLEKLRLLLKKDSHAELARFVGIANTTWNNYMRGFNLPLRAARQIKAKVPGVTLDWLIDGDGDKLPVDLAGELGALPGPTGSHQAAPKSSRRR